MTKPLLHFSIETDRYLFLLFSSKKMIQGSIVYDDGKKVVRYWMHVN